MQYFIDKSIINVLATSQNRAPRNGANSSLGVIAPVTQENTLHSTTVVGYMEICLFSLSKSFKTEFYSANIGYVLILFVFYKTKCGIFSNMFGSSCSNIVALYTADIKTNPKNHSLYQHRSTDRLSSDPIKSFFGNLFPLKITY